MPDEGATLSFKAAPPCVDHLGRFAFLLWQAAHTRMNGAFLLERRPIGSGL